MPELSFVHVLKAEIVARGAATDDELRAFIYSELSANDDATEHCRLRSFDIRDWTVFTGEKPKQTTIQGEERAAALRKLVSELEPEIEKGWTDKLKNEVLEKLNARMASGPAILDLNLLEENIRPSYQRIVPTEKWTVTNRLLLQDAFPNVIAEASPTRAILYNWLHAHPSSALCLSGGGIRSATFALGVIQGLASHGILKSFDYLSTVSGGGYIGSWLSCWIQRTSLKTVESELDRNRPRDPENPEPAPLRYLRQYSNYLTPRLGLTSADTWTLIGTYLRNLVLNWIIFVPFIAAFLMIPRICVAALGIDLPLWGLSTVGVIACLSAVWSICYVAMHLPRDHTDQKGSNSPAAIGPPDGTSKKKPGQTQFLISCLAPLWVSATAFTAFWCWLQEFNPAANTLRNLFYGSESTPRLWQFLVLGAGIQLAAFASYIWRLPGKPSFWARLVAGLREFLICVVSGLAGGALLYVSCIYIFQSGTFNDIPVLEVYVWLAAPVFLSSFLIAGVLYIGLASRFSNDAEREWWARMGAWVLIAVLGWTLFSGLVIFGPELLLAIPRLAASVGGLSGLITLLLAHSGSTAANTAKTTEPGLSTKVTNFFLGLAAPLFIAAFVASISLGTSALIRRLDKNTVYTATSLCRNDIVDWSMFVSHLEANADPASSFLLEKLSPALRLELRTNRPAVSLAAPVRNRLERELQMIIATNELDWRVFGHNRPPFQTDGSPVESKQYKRMLLQQAFPLEVQRNPFDHLVIIHKSPFSLNLLLLIIFGAVSLVLARCININCFTLHGVYRDRLIRAYLGASNAARDPNPFSGFDPNDNLALAQLRTRPFHIINMAMNLTAGEKLAWQQRKAASFTASPLHAGSCDLGYRHVSEYACGPKPFQNARLKIKQASNHTRFFHKLFNTENDRAMGLKVGTAVTISGAAASPNMGYHSSPVIAALMTLFNIRLGAWLGNPGPAGETSYTHATPRYPFMHLLKEACGLTTSKSEYVYLSDGGHFENLGLYEMVLRRCHTIVVSDAGCDPACALEDLGNAIRKIRIDLGVSIVIDQFAILARGRRFRESKYCAIGTIRYDEVDAPGLNLSDEDKKKLRGTLVYIKPALSGKEPRDIFSYRETSLIFPHEPTSDQWFSESQFESYRALGYHIVATISGDDWSRNPADPLAEFVSQAQKYLGTDSPAKSATTAQAQS